MTEIILASNLRYSVLFFLETNKGMIASILMAEWIIHYVRLFPSKTCHLALYFNFIYYYFQ